MIDLETMKIRLAALDADAQAKRRIMKDPDLPAEQYREAAYAFYNAYDVYRAALGEWNKATRHVPGSAVVAE